MKQNAFVTLSGSSFSPMYLLRKELERDFFGEQNSIEDREQRLNYLETDDAYLATIDIPGVNPVDVNIDLMENNLTVNAERKFLLAKDSNQIKKYNYSLNLPKNIQAELISAHYENGVLSLTIPKNLENKSKKKIEVSTGAKPKSWSNFLNFKKAEIDKFAN